MKGVSMTDASTRTIDVDGDVYDILERTAKTRKTDPGEVVKYLLSTMPVREGGTTDDDE